jgi:HSP20 family protein
MTVLRFDPFGDFDRLADRAWGRGHLTGIPMDAYRRGNELVLQFDLPGVDPATVDVTVERNVLTVSAERTSNRQEDDRVVASERPTGRFTRQIRLGRGLDTDRVSAGYDAGVLTVTLPVAEEVQPRRVEVQTGPAEPAVGAGTDESAAA